MRDCKKCQNDTFGVREKCHFLIQIEESEKKFLIEVPKKEKSNANFFAKREDVGINY